MMQELSAAARVLAAQRRRAVIRCEECGVEFEATSRRRFCSNTCNVRAWRRHRKEQAPRDSMLVPPSPAGAADAVRPLAMVEAGGQRHTAAWWEVRLAAANLRASLAQLRATGDSLPLNSAAVARFTDAGAALHAALAEHHEV